jgi:hypothetical protein
MVWARSSGKVESKRSSFSSRVVGMEIPLSLFSGLASCACSAQAPTYQLVWRARLEEAA